MSNPPWTAPAASLPLRPILWLTVLFALFQASLFPGHAQTTTNFEIGTTVQQAGAKRFGVNLAGQNFYDSGQMMRNLTFMNPGFEGELWQSVLQCVTVTANTCQDADIYNVWPANFLQNASFQFISGAAIGETGTIVSSTTASYQGNQGVTMTFSAPLSPMPAAGDWLIVRMEVPGNAQAGWWTNTSGGAALSTDTTDIASDSPGKQALEISASGSGQSASVAQYFDTTPGRSFVQLNGTYTLTFRAKGLGGNNQLNVSIGRLATQSDSFLNQNVTLTNQWQDYSYTFNAAENGTYIGPVQVNFSVSGASLYLDDVALTEPAAADNPTAFRNAVVDRLRQLHPGIIRDMAVEGFGTTIDNALAVPFARQRAGWSEISSEEDEIPIGLHDFLTLCQAVGAEPWYTMPVGMTTTEMQNLIQYLAGDASTPYGAIRASLGQSAPWTSVFPVIHLELGNEVWNMGTFPGESIGSAAVYGNLAATLFAAARATPGYNPSNFDLIMGSQEVNTWITGQEMANSSGYDSVDIAPYIFGTFDDDSSNEAIYGPMFAEPEMVDSTATGYVAEQAAIAASGTTPAKLDVYEVNLGTSFTTAPQNTVNSVVGSVGGGIAVADHMFLMLRDDGVINQNMYALSEYANSITNTAIAGETMPLWGNVIDMGGETNTSRPTFLAEQLANSAILPTMLAVTTTGANPTWNQPLSANDSVQLNGAHYLQAFAFTNGTQNSVVVFNLSRTGSLPVTFSGANAPSGDVLVSQLTSANITDNNENLTSDAPVVNTTQTNVSNFNPATSYSLPPFSMTVFLWPGSTLPPSTTTLTANPTSGAAGQSIALTATVTSQSGTNTPTGTVSFLDGAATLGTATLDANGVATFSTTTLPAGTDSITASYAGDANDAGSLSSPVTVTVTSNAVPTTTVLTASSTAINTGQNVSFTATVTPQSGSATPSGNVNFMNGTTLLGTASLNSSGVVSFSATALPAGADSITASYVGNTNDDASTSAAVTVNVTQTVTATATTLIASASQIALGQNVTFTATVTPTSGTVVPSGTVTFLDGTTTLGTATLNLSGTASFSTTTLPIGSNSITASYGGSGSNSTSVSSAVTVTVSQAVVATTTTLTASPTAINTGQSLTLTAAVAPQSGTATPSGTVTFLNGGTILGTAPLSAGGIATLNTTALPAGTDSITAAYGGSAANSASTSAPVVVTVTQSIVATTTTLVASATQIVAGQNLTLTATVVPQSGTARPSGTVTFLDGSTVLGTAPLSGGQASFSTSALAAGQHTVTASYGGSARNSASSSGPVTITVASAPVQTTTTLTSSAAAINTGQSITFTATVTPKTGGGSVPIFPVAFLDGSTIIGTANVNANGIATFTTAALPAGADQITASYTGNNSDLSSVSAPVVVTVTQTVVATTTSLTASSTQLTSGQDVTFTATVVPQSGTTTPHGTVTFLDGSTPLGTASLNAEGTAFFGTASLTVGTHSITAAYGGSASDAKSVSAPLSVTVAQSVTPTETALAASATQISYNENVTLTAVVTPRSGNTVPAGAVAFLDGSTILATAQLNASGAAIFSTKTLGIGTHSITASYEGSSSNSSSISSPIEITVAAPQGTSTVDTTTFLTASSTQLIANQNVTFTATVVPEYSDGIPTGSVTFTDGSTNLGSGSLNFNGTASLSTSSLAVGTHSIIAVYGGSSLDNGSSSSPVAVVVSAATAPAPPPAPAAPAATATTLTASASQVTVGDSVSFSAAVTASAGGSTPAGTVQFLDGQTILGSATLSANATAVFSTAALAVGTHSITANYSGSSTDAASASAPFTVTVAAAGTPGYTMVVSSSDVMVTPGQVANLTVTLTPENGFNMPVNLTCSGIPAGTSCSFSPPTVTPNGEPVSSTLSILIAPPAGSSTTAQNRAPRSSLAGRFAFGLTMPWGLFSLLGLSTRKKRSRLAAWSLRLVVAASLIAGSLWISGCGYSVNGSVFTMTLTSSGANVPTHTSQITVNVME